MASEERMAEGAGFEPAFPFGIPVFKTGALSRSATPPQYLFYRRAGCLSVRAGESPLMGRGWSRILQYVPLLVTICHF